MDLGHRLERIDQVISGDAVGNGITLEIVAEVLDHDGVLAKRCARRVGRVLRLAPKVLASRNVDESGVVGVVPLLAVPSSLVVVVVVVVLMDAAICVVGFVVSKFSVSTLLN